MLGTLGLRILDSFTWNSEGMGTMPPILPLEASEILIVDSMGLRQGLGGVLVWSYSVSLELFKLSGLVGSRVVFKSKCLGLLPVTSEQVNNLQIQCHDMFPIRLIKLVLLWLSSDCSANILEGEVKIKTKHSRCISKRQDRLALRTAFTLSLTLAYNQWTWRP